MPDDNEPMGLFDHDPSSRPPPPPPPDPLAPNLAEGERRRDAGMALVAENAGDWFDRAVALVEQFWAAGAPDEEFTGEQIRRWVVRRIGEPHKPNAWGALVNTAGRRKIIVDTGDWRKMEKPTSHGRRTPVYVWGDP